MTRTLFALFLTALLLCGCSAQAPLSREEAPAENTSAVSAAEGLYDPASDLESATGGALRVFVLPDTVVTGFLPTEGGVILLTQSGEGTLLTRLEGEKLIPSETCQLDFLLTTASETLRTGRQGISFFDSSTMQTRILDSRLHPAAALNAPEGLVGMALLSEDFSTLYYCTADAVRALDLESGISRVLKESSYPVQSVSGLLLGDSVLQLSITDANGQWQSLYLDTASGQLLHQYPGNPRIFSSGDFYAVTVLSGSNPLHLFGNAGEATQTLLPRDLQADCFFLPESRRAVTFSFPGSGQTTVDCYDLQSGIRAASLSLPERLYPGSVLEAPEGQLWLQVFQENTGQEILLRWDTSLSSLSDSTPYTGTYHTRENPDYDGLAACALQARQISEKYGVEVLIYKDAVETQPWDYTLEYEYQVSVLRQELARLEQHLGNYPEGFLKTLAEKFTGIRIRIVHSLSPNPGTTGPQQVSGIQFWEDYTANIVLAAGEDTEKALYHELCHLIDTVVLTESVYYDRWDTLNPAGFSYDMDYEANRSRDGSAWLQPGQASFIDTYSMSFPKEDRARIMEYAMASGNGELFRSGPLQAKLNLLCLGIRDAFGLQENPESFLWEQYLLSPLTQ